MFDSTFSGCTSLQSIPENLFSGVSGSAENMFGSTFSRCKSLQSIPENLFSGVTGSSDYMFHSTFSGCTSLKSLPNGLFKNIEGRPATNAFRYTFNTCSNLSGYIPSDMFKNMDSTDYTSGPMTDIFSGTNLDTVCPARTYQYITGFESDWSRRVSCGTCPDGMTAIDGVCTKVDCAENQMLVDGACVEPEFTITTTNMAAGSKFSFQISASGTFYVDFDDGQGTRKIEKPNTTNTTYSSVAYANAGTHTIKMYGGATGYTTSSQVAAISFKSNTNIKSVDGSLGAIFGGSANYMFYYTFSGCSSLKSISSGLFTGVTDGAQWMFSETFGECSSLEEVPKGLFNNVKGGAENMFNSVFYKCNKLQTVPSDLFAGAKGPAYKAMFRSAFNGCKSLNNIPDGLFAGISGSAPELFWLTFHGCESLDEVPRLLFGDLSGSAERMFHGTFSTCTSLKSVPDKLFAGVIDAADYMFSYTFQYSGLEEIQENLFSGINGGAQNMFVGTFLNCSNLKKLPNGLFKNITGKSATDMFYDTFKNCTSLSGYIPSDMFENLDSTDFNASTMSNIFTSTALDTQCPAGMYQYITGFESAWNGKVSCAPCPAGTTSAAGASDISQCVAGRTLHIGDDITMNLTTTRPTTPRVMVFQVLDELYYGGLSDTEKTINKNTDKKFRIFFDNKDYWLHDYTVE